jgi:hypothetical protein
MFAPTARIPDLLVTKSRRKFYKRYLNNDIIRSVTDKGILYTERSYGLVHFALGLRNPRLTLLNNHLLRQTPQYLSPRNIQTRPRIPHCLNLPGTHPTAPDKEVSDAGV